VDLAVQGLIADHAATTAHHSAPLFGGPGGVLAAAASVMAVLFLITWLLSLRLRDASVVDPIWGPAFVLVALTGALVGDGDASRRWLLLALTAVWGLRLGWHLTTRKLHEPGEDRRYTALRESHPDNFPLWSLGWVYGLQGLLVLIISLPLQVGAERPDRLSWAIVPGLILYLIGVAFESIGDEQLRRFKSRPQSAGHVMDRGLWRYTRHPNYFGDACVWWGIWLVVLPADGTWWTAVGPALITLFLVRISGKEMLERDIAQRRPGYADYIRRTPGFIPRPPRPPRANSAGEAPAD
jgi:steroid 5-alpha reductase family enzyme